MARLQVQGWHMAKCLQKELIQSSDEKAADTKGCVFGQMVSSCFMVGNSEILKI
jgi:hypothetical protein